MARNELKNLRRRDLLEMLIDLSKENEQLRKKLSEAEAKVQKREIALNDSESLAEACLRLGGVLEAMQTACDEYKANVYRNCEKLMEQGKINCDKI